VRAAADHFGFVQPTVVAHESGTNSVTRRSALGYAAAYGVSPEWLLRGLAAFGLGPLVDASLASADDWENLDIRELRKLADVDGEKDTMGLRRLLRERQWARVAESDGDNIPELSARQLELGAEFNFEASKFWKLQTGVPTSLIESEAGALVVLPLELSQGRFSGGDRLFIDITKRDLRSNGTFAYIVNGTLRVVDASFDLPPTIRRFCWDRSLASLLVCPVPPIDDARRCTQRCYLLDVEGRHCRNEVADSCNRSSVSAY
jgi:hypothetical protein